MQRRSISREQYSPPFCRSKWLLLVVLWIELVDTAKAKGWSCFVFRPIRIDEMVGLVLLNAKTGCPMNTAWSANYISFQESRLVSRITLTMCLHYSVSAQVKLLDRGIMLTGTKDCKRGGKGSHNRRVRNSQVIISCTRFQIFGVFTRFQLFEARFQKKFAKLYQNCEGINGSNK